MSEENNEVQDPHAGFETVMDDAPVVEPEVEADTEESYSGADAAAESQNKKSGVQKRIDELVREREKANRRADKAEKALADRSSKSEEPQEGDFDSYDEYLDAVSEYEQKDSAADQENPDAGGEQQEAEAPSLSESQQDALAVLQEHIAQDAEKPEDFNEVALNPDVPISGEMLESIVECDDPTKVMYQLGKDPELAGKIYDMKPAQQARAIAKLDLAPNPKAQKPVETSKAADPISPVGGSDAQKQSISEMSYADYEAEMNAKERARAGH